jgi:hypothetical protein
MTFNSLLFLGEAIKISNFGTRYLLIKKSK